MLPQLLFLLPGNHALQCIKPRGPFPPARFPGSAACIYKAWRVFPLGQIAEQLLSAQLEPPQPPRLPGANLAPFAVPPPLGSAPKALEKHSNFFLLGRAGASPCCEAAAAGRMLPPFFFLFFLGRGGAPESPGAGHHVVEMAALPGGTIHLPHALETRRGRWRHDAPVTRAPSARELGRRLPVTAALQRWHGGTSLPGGLCGKTAGAAAKSAPLPGVPPRQPRGPAAICVLWLIQASPRRSYKNKCLNVKPAAWGFVAVFGRRSNMSLNVLTVLTKIVLLLST